MTPHHNTSELQEVFAGDDATSVFEPRFRVKPKLTKDEVRQIQKSIEETQQPRSNKGPPKNLGEKGHGKLKATNGDRR